MSTPNSETIPFFVQLAPAISALVGVAVGGFIQHFLGIRSQLKIEKSKNRQQAYSKLMGIKFIITQLYVSRFEALIFSDFHEAKWKANGCPRDSLDLQETFRWMQKSEDLALEIANTNQSLFEILGSITISFRATKELRNLVEKIYYFKTPDIKFPKDITDLKILELTKTKAVQALQALVEKEYRKPIENLLSYLEKNLNK